MYKEILKEDLDKFIDFEIKLEHYIQSNCINGNLLSNKFVKQQLIIFKTDFPKKQKEMLKLYNIWKELNSPTTLFC